MVLNLFIGWALTILGILFIVLSFIAAARIVFQRGAPAPPSGTGQPDVKFLEFLLKVLGEWSKLPLWMALAVLGIALIYIGQRYASGRALLGG